ncbi:MAG: biopolymer transporter ExbD [Chitinophagaceae bacterium]
MPKHKVVRKSTPIDMTAMCDVAFLLLAFFILTTKFKPSEALAVVTPNSVSNKIAPQKDVVLITIDKDGQVYLSVSDDNTKEKRALLEEINNQNKLGLTEADIKNFLNSGSYIGVPFAKLKSYLALTPEELKKTKIEGIPVLDSTNNQLTEWMRAAATAFAGSKMNLLVKGDNASKYPSFQAVINAFKKNDMMKFQMITNPEAVPAGTELYKNNMKLQGEAAAAE